MARYRIKLRNSAREILKLYTVSFVSLSKNWTLLEHVPIIFFSLSLSRSHTHHSYSSSNRKQGAECEDALWASKSFKIACMLNWTIHVILFFVVVFFCPFLLFFRLFSIETEWISMCCFLCSFCRKWFVFCSNMLKLYQNVFRLIFYSPLAHQSCKVGDLMA